MPRLSKSACFAKKCLSLFFFSWCYSLWPFGVKPYLRRCSSARRWAALRGAIYLQLLLILVGCKGALYPVVSDPQHCSSFKTLKALWPCHVLPDSPSWKRMILILVIFTSFFLKWQCLLLNFTALLLSFWATNICCFYGINSGCWLEC